VPIDVHLMVRPVDALVLEFAKAGAASISFHPEASEHVDRSLRLIREHGCEAGLVLNPASPLALVEPVLELIDFVLLMSVNPGFGGQRFISYVLSKVEAARRMLDASGRDIWLEVDGGIKPDNVGQLVARGADTIVAGSAVFEAPDYAVAIRELRNAAREHSRG
jgi:ribulose-phosphate 3-epimerase